jgi:translation elongation factor EF-1alpha
MNATKQQVEAILNQFDPFTSREQADEAAVKLIALRTIPSVKQVKQLGRFLWNADWTVVTVGAITERINKLKV